MADATPPHPKAPGAHPCPRADLPPTAEECGDRGTYCQPWWQGSMFSLWWQAALIVLAIFVGRLILMRFVGPMLGP